MNTSSHKSSGGLHFGDPNPFHVGSSEVHAAEEIGEKVTHPGRAGLQFGNQVKQALVEPIAKAFGELIEGYGLRLGEILAGAALVMFGLVTIARGGEPPKLPGPLR